MEIPTYPDEIDDRDTIARLSEEVRLLRDVRPSELRAAMRRGYNIAKAEAAIAGGWDGAESYIDWDDAEHMLKLELQDVGKENH